MTDKSITQLAESKTREYLDTFFTNATVLLRNLQELPVTNATADLLEDIINGLQDLRPSTEDMKIDAEAEMDEFHHAED